MKIEFNKVTWYSKLLAVVLFVATFWLAFYLGREFERARQFEQNVVRRVLESRMPAYADQSKWKVWQDGDYSKQTGIFTKYELRYPRDFDVYRYDSASGGFVGKSRVKISFPQDAFKSPVTNFGEAYIAVSVGLDSSSVRNCLKKPDAPGVFSDTESIHGLTFYGGAATDAAAGNLYTSRIFRLPRKTACYEMVLTVHTGNIANYPPGVAEFDKNLALPLLDQVARSFRIKESSGPGGI